MIKEIKDIHKENAAKIFNISEDAVTPSMRWIAKTMLFSKLYGASDEVIKKAILNNKTK